MPDPTTSTAAPAIRHVKRQLLATASRLARGTTAPRCCCLAVGLFLLVRGVSTLTGGAGYGLPGDGWRAILQLVLATLLLAAITRRRAARNAVIVVGLIYAAETLLGLGMHDIFGIIPVDSRDHIVHPAIAILALTAAAITGRSSVDLQAQPPNPD